MKRNGMIRIGNREFSIEVAEEDEKMVKYTWAEFEKMTEKQLCKLMKWTYKHLPESLKYFDKRLRRLFLETLAAENNENNAKSRIDFLYSSDQIFEHQSRSTIRKGARVQFYPPMLLGQAMKILPAGLLPKGVVTDYFHRRNSHRCALAETWCIPGYVNGDKVMPCTRPAYFGARMSKEFWTMVLDKNIPLTYRREYTHSYMCKYHMRMILLEPAWEGELDFWKTSHEHYEDKNFLESVYAQHEFDIDVIIAVIGSYDFELANAERSYFDLLCEAATDARTQKLCRDLRFIVRERRDQRGNLFHNMKSSKFYPLIKEDDNEHLMEAVRSPDKVRSDAIFLVQGGTGEDTNKEEIQIDDENEEYYDTPVSADALELLREFYPDMKICKKKEDSILPTDFDYLSAAAIALCHVKDREKRREKARREAERKKINNTVKLPIIIPPGTTDEQMKTLETVLKQLIGPETVDEALHLDVKDICNMNSVVSPQMLAVFKSLYTTSDFIAEHEGALYKVHRVPDPPSRTIDGLCLDPLEAYNYRPSSRDAQTPPACNRSAESAAELLKKEPKLSRTIEGLCLAPLESYGYRPSSRQTRTPPSCTWIVDAAADIIKNVILPEAEGLAPQESYGYRPPAAQTPAKCSRSDYAATFPGPSAETSKATICQALLDPYADRPCTSAQAEAHYARSVKVYTATPATDPCATSLPGPSGVKTSCSYSQPTTSKRVQTQPQTARSHPRPSTKSSKSAASPLLKASLLPLYTGTPKQVKEDQVVTVSHTPSPQAKDGSAARMTPMRRKTLLPLPGKTLVPHPRKTLLPLPVAFGEGLRFDPVSDDDDDDEIQYLGEQPYQIPQAEPSVSAAPSSLQVEEDEDVDVVASDDEEINEYDRQIMEQMQAEEEERQRRETEKIVEEERMKVRKAVEEQRALERARAQQEQVDLQKALAESYRMEQEKVLEEQRQKKLQEKTKADFERQQKDREESKRAEREELEQRMEAERQELEERIASERLQKEIELRIEAERRQKELEEQIEARRQLQEALKQENQAHFTNHSIEVLLGREGRQAERESQLESRRMGREEGDRALFTNEELGLWDRWKVRLDSIGSVKTLDELRERNAAMAEMYDVPQEQRFQGNDFEIDLDDLTPKNIKKLRKQLGLKHVSRSHRKKSNWKTFPTRSTTWKSTLVRCSPVS